MISIINLIDSDIEWFSRNKILCETKKQHRMTNDDREKIYQQITKFNAKEVVEKKYMLVLCWESKLAKRFDFPIRCFFVRYHKDDNLVTDIALQPITSVYNTK